MKFKAYSSFKIVYKQDYRQKLQIHGLNQLLIIMHKMMGTEIKIRFKKMTEDMLTNLKQNINKLSYGLGPCAEKKRKI